MWHLRWVIMFWLLTGWNRNVKSAKCGQSEPEYFWILFLLNLIKLISLWKFKTDNTGTKRSKFISKLYYKCLKTSDWPNLNRFIKMLPVWCGSRNIIQLMWVVWLLSGFLVWIVFIWFIWWMFVSVLNSTDFITTTNNILMIDFFLEPLISSKHIKCVIIVS